MQNGKEFNDAVPMVPLNGGRNSATETDRTESIKTASSTPSPKSISMNSRENVSESVTMDVPPFVEKTASHEHAVNVLGSDINSMLPPAMQSIKQDERGNGSNDSTKQFPSPDCPDGFNQYRNQKSFSQGMLDIALFIGNVNHLKSVTRQSSQYGSFEFFSVIALLLGSILLQIAVGLILLLSSRYDVSKEEERKTVYRMGNYVVAGIFLITVLNLFIGVFYDYGNPVQQQLIKDNS